MRECGLRLMGVAFGLCLSWQVSSQMPGPVDGDSRRSDVSFLDSLLGPRMTESVRDADGLAARDALLEAMLDEGPLQALEWAVLVHGWLRAAGDPHMRVPFDHFFANVFTHIIKCKYILFGGYLRQEYYLQ